MWWLHPWGEPEPEPSVPLEYVYIHGHCWLDPEHVLQLKVIKRESENEHHFECKKCEVKEKAKPCDLPCDIASFV